MIRLVTQPETDRSLSSQGMRAYLRYRLYQVESELDDLMIQAHGRGGLGQTEPVYSNKPATKDWMSRWTSMAYLMSARNDIRDELRKLASQGYHR